MLKTQAGDIVGSGAPGLFPGQTEQDILLSREEVAAYLKCSLPTLELWPRNGEGPRVVRVGRALATGWRTCGGSSRPALPAPSRRDVPWLKMRTARRRPGAAEGCSGNDNTADTSTRPPESNGAVHLAEAIERGTRPQSAPPGPPCSTRSNAAGC